LVKNRNIGKNRKLFVKIEILVQNRIFCGKSKVWSKIKILVKIENY